MLKVEATNPGEAHRGRKARKTDSPEAVSRRQGIPFFHLQKYTVKKEAIKKPALRLHIATERNRKVRFHVSPLAPPPPLLSFFFPDASPRETKNKLKRRMEAGEKVIERKKKKKIPLIDEHAPV